MLTPFRLLILATSVWALTQLASRTLDAADYDPLRASVAEIEFKDWTVRDESHGREIPIRVYLPPVNSSSATTPAPLVIFSHGLGGNRQGSAYLGKHWAGRGFVVVHLQHAGSDDSVWRDLPLSQRMDALRKAASIQNYLARVQDVPAVLDQLEAWNADDSGHELQGRLDLTQVGMSGHSFGAGTTQGVSGQAAGLIGQRYTDPRIKAALPLSPSSPARGDTQTAFGRVKIPWLLMTGTHDGSPIGNQTPESRLTVFPALPPGDKYQLVLDKAEHSAFGDRALPGESLQRNPNHHRAILAISTAFWDAYLRDDADAKAWLTGDAPRTVLEPSDVWEKK
jgi:predicted dienelactone hydrolase